MQAFMINLLKMIWKTSEMSKRKQSCMPFACNTKGFTYLQEKNLQK